LSLYALDISGAQPDKTRQTETIKPTHKGDRGHTSSRKSRHTFHFSIYHLFASEMDPRKVRNVQEYHNMYRPAYTATIIHTSLYIIIKDFMGKTSCGDIRILNFTASTQHKKY